MSRGKRDGSDRKEFVNGRKIVECMWKVFISRGIFIGHRLIAVQVSPFILAFYTY